MWSEIQGYVNYLKVERNASPYTVRNYSDDLGGFLDFLRREGIKTLEEVDHHIVRRYLAHLQKRGFAKASIARKLSAIRSFYRYLMQRGILSSNPLLTMSSPKLKKQLPSFLSIEEMEQLLKAPNISTPQGQRDKAILELFYAAGLRVSEVVQLNLNHVDLISREIRVWGKGSKERVVLMGEPAVNTLQLYLHQGRHRLLDAGRADALFVNRYGKRISSRSIQTMVARYAREAGITTRVHPHMLRHTFATQLLNGGADLRVVQELLGHASLTSTQIYTHVTGERVRDVYLSSHPGARNKA
jgi:integrase/recombinase XerC